MLQRIELDEGWRFWRSAEGDGAPESVRVPHDAMLGERRSPDAETGGAGAYFPGGTYRYEHDIDVPESWRGLCVTAEFEGVYRHATVSLNGRELAYHANGYTGFRVPLDGALRYGERNVLCVVADNGQVPNSRWYSGAGIYRPARILVQPPRHIEPGGVHVRTTYVGADGRDSARIYVSARHNAGGQAGLYVEVTLDGEVVATAEAPAGSSPEDDVIATEVDVPDARPWSDENPQLYGCRVLLTWEPGSEIAILDEERTTFGIRLLQWGEEGLLVNGVRTKLRGGCIHHDNGILGSADVDAMSFLKVRLLKSWGFNAVRSAHNPMSDGMLRACDELGMYVIDEFSDVWYEAKSPHDYSLDFEEWHERDVASMVGKDFNHPCVVMYSVGNEVSEPATERGLDCAGELSALFHRLDPSRPITCGNNPTLLYLAARGTRLFSSDGSRTDGRVANAVDRRDDPTRGPSGLLHNVVADTLVPGMEALSRTRGVGRASDAYLAQVDVAGYNYATARYDADLARYPERLIVGSQTMCYDIARTWGFVEAPRAWWETSCGPRSTTWARRAWARGRTTQGTPGPRGRTHGSPTAAAPSTSSGRPRGRPPWPTSPSSRT